MLSARGVRQRSSRCERGGQESEHGLLLGRQLLPELGWGSGRAGISETSRDRRRGPLAARTGSPSPTRRRDRPRSPLRRAGPSRCARWPARCGRRRTRDVPPARTRRQSPAQRSPLAAESPFPRRRSISERWHRAMSWTIVSPMVRPAARRRERAWAPSRSPSSSRDLPNTRSRPVRARGSCSGTSASAASPVSASLSRPSAARRPAVSSASSARRSELSAPSPTASGSTIPTRCATSAQRPAS